MPKNSGTSNTNEVPNYIFCQHFDPPKAHDRKRCDCFDIKQVFRSKTTKPQSDNCSTDQASTSK